MRSWAAVRWLGRTGLGGINKRRPLGPSQMLGRGLALHFIGQGACSAPGKTHGQMQPLLSLASERGQVLGRQGLGVCRRKLHC